MAGGHPLNISDDMELLGKLEIVGEVGMTTQRRQAMAWAQRADRARRRPSSTHAGHASVGFTSPSLLSRVLGTAKWRPVCSALCKLHMNRERCI